MELLDGDRSTIMSSFVKGRRNIGGGSLVCFCSMAASFVITLRGSSFQAACLLRQCKADEQAHTLS